MRYRLRTLLILLAVSALLPPGQAFADEKDPVVALFGEWEVEEMIYRATIQDFGGTPRGKFVIEGECLTMFYGGQTTGFKLKLRVRPGGLDLRDDDVTTKALYKLENGKLLIVWRSDNERPANFDALNDPRLTLYVLKKVK